MGKLLFVGWCGDCSYLNEDTDECMEGLTRIMREDTSVLSHVDGGTTPKWCPLPDAPEQEGE